MNFEIVDMLKGEIFNNNPEQQLMMFGKIIMSIANFEEMFKTNVYSLL